jgi:hypothetical protein
MSKIKCAKTIDPNWRARAREVLAQWHRDGMSLAEKESAIIDIAILGQKIAALRLLTELHNCDALQAMKILNELVSPRWIN